VVSEVIIRLASKYPHLTYDVMISDLDTLIGELRQRTRDVVVTRWAPLPVADDLAVQTLSKTSLAVMAAQGHPLLRRRKLSLGNLMDERWTLSPPGSFLGRVVVDLFRRRNLPLPPTIVTTISIHMRLHLLASGGFLTILPDQMLRYPPNRAWLRALGVDLRDSSQPIASITLKRRRASGAVKLFEQVSVEVCKMMAKAQ
jgi:DNA-binding transcriptional LysR family regulator